MKYAVLLLVGFVLGTSIARADYNIAVTGTSSGPVWGSSPYTSDSSFGKAAVHAGLIIVGQTATIRIHEVGTISSFSGSTANGITTSSYDAPWAAVTLSLVQASVPPTISISTPTSVYTNQSFNITVNAADTNGDLSSMGLRYEGVGQIAWWGNGQISGASASRSHAASPIAAPGQARFRGEVFDAAGNGTTGPWHLVQVNSPPVNQPPAVSFTGPATLSVGQQGTWTFSATDGNLWRYRVILLSGTAQWTYNSQCPPTAFPYTFTTSGTYTWRFEAEDADQVVSFVERTVTVASVPPGLTYTVSSSYSSFPNYPQGAPSFSYLTDGLHNNNYGYASDTDTYNWLKADLGSAKLVQSVTLGGGNITGWGPASSYSSGATLEYSNDNVTWSNAHTFSTGFSPTDTLVTPNITARYWRVARTGWFATTEFRFVGTTPTVPSVTSALKASGTVGASFNYQITATNSPTSYAATGLPGGLSLTPSSGLISGTPSTTATSNITLSAANGNGTSAPVTLVLTVAAPAGSPGQAAYTTAGTHTWVAPAGISSVSVVAVGGGAGGGGGGGALAWKNNITVVPGTGYVVVVGAGGTPNAPGGYDGGHGGASSFTAGFGTMTAGGGRAQGTVLGGVRSGVYDGGGDGGKGTDRTMGGYAGGGAGGYSGNGGMSEFPWYTWGGGQPGAGGGGAGGAYPHSSGGGVGILGVGTSGASGGQGGSGGGNGALYAVGGAYGGGGAGFTGVDGQGGRAGGGGAIRIIWGAGRSFPSTNAGDVTPGAPVITSAPTASGTLGSSFVYQITATNSPTSYTASGLPGGLSFNSSSGLISGSPTATGTSNVSLTATNALGASAATTLVLTVASAPVITTQPSSAAADFGSTATFSAAATGSPPPTYQWRKNGSNLSNGGNVSGATAATLTLSNLQSSDSGTYTVNVTSGSISVLSASATLTVAASQNDAANQNQLNIHIPQL